MNSTLYEILGPRVPQSEWWAHRVRYLLPGALLLVAGALLAVSYWLPYWGMTLHAPQYPKGLHVTAYLNRLQGDVHEIDGLNHYIGMRPLNEAAQFERTASALLVVVFILLLVGAMFIHSQWAALLTLPAVGFPLGFLADLYYWLASFGNNLDPHAALSSAIKPFVPPVLGVGLVGQFKTVAEAGEGLWLATAASGVIVIALWLHRRAYKPLVDAGHARPNVGSALALAMQVLVVALCSQSTAVASEPTPTADIHALVRAAQPGQVIHVPAGTYAGPVVIDKPLTLIGDGRAIIDAGGHGDAVRILAPDVSFRGFQVRGTGVSLDQQNTGILAQVPRATIEDNQLDDVLVGILLNAANDSIVRGNHVRGKLLALPRRGDGIRLWSSHRCKVEDNEVADARDVVIWYSEDARILRNTVTHGRYGLHFMYSSGSHVEDNRLADNSVGAFLMYSHDITLCRNVLDHNRGPSGYGIGLKDMDGVALEDNVFAANRVGLYLDNSPSRVDREHTFRGNIFAYNDIGIATLPAVQRNHFTDNTFIENVEQIAVWGDGQLKNNTFSVDRRGNYWSDYAGFDANGDGIGDVPYQAVSLFENLMDREPKLRMFIYSPAQQAIEFAAHAFPIMRPEPKITDPTPLMQPVAMGSVAHRTASVWPMLSVSGLLLGAAGFLLSGVRGPRSLRVKPDTSCATSILPVQSDRLEAGPTLSGRTLHATEPIVRISDLTKAFGRNVAVNGLSLDVMPGEAVALWGENGAGKTTVIKCLLGLQRFRGSIRVGVFDVARQGRDARELIGYVSQEFAFYDDLTVEDAARLFARLKGVAIARVPEVLRQVDLIEHTWKRVSALSGGMKQRLALAVALLADPPLLVLDEPTSNLDAGARRAFFSLLRDLQQGGKTIIFTTHRPEEVAALADRVVVLERGRVVRESTPHGFMETAGARVVMRVSVEPRCLNTSLQLLLREGFDASLNHTAVLVRVAYNEKILPLAALQRGGVQIDDFHVERENNDDC